MNRNRIIARANVPVILDGLGIRYQRRGDELVARCFSGRHEDRKPSWSIHDGFGSEKHGLHSCFSCGFGGTVIDLVQHVRGCTWQDAIDVVRGLQVEDVGREVKQSFCVERFYPREVPRPRLVFPIRDGSRCMEYLAGRGFGRVVIERFGLEDWLLEKRVFVPMTRRKVLISWAGRTYDQSRLRVQTPNGNSQGAIWAMFGLDLVDVTEGFVHICEGWASAIRVWQAGFQNVIAINGSSFTMQKVMDLAWAGKVILWKEGDIGGESLEADCRAWFSGKDFVVVQLPVGKDPADYTPDELGKFHRRKK